MKGVGGGELDEGRSQVSATSGTVTRRRARGNSGWTRRASAVYSNAHPTWSANAAQNTKGLSSRRTPATASPPANKAVSTRFIVGD